MFWTGNSNWEEVSKSSVSEYHCMRTTLLRKSDEPPRGGTTAAGLGYCLLLTSHRSWRCRSAICFKLLTWTRKRHITTTTHLFWIWLFQNSNGVGCRGGSRYFEGVWWFFGNPQNTKISRDVKTIPKVSTFFRRDLCP